jgi:hypothetical protein
MNEHSLEHHPPGAPPWARIPWQRDPFEVPFAWDAPCPVCATAPGALHDLLILPDGRRMVCPLEVCPIQAPGCEGLYATCDCDARTGEAHVY